MEDAQREPNIKKATRQSQKRDGERRRKLVEMIVCLFVCFKSELIILFSNMLGLGF